MASPENIVSDTAGTEGAAVPGTVEVATSVPLVPTTDSDSSPAPVVVNVASAEPAKAQLEVLSTNETAKVAEASVAAVTATVPPLQRLSGEDVDAIRPELLRAATEVEEQPQSTWEVVKEFFKPQGRAKELKKANKVPFTRLFKYADSWDMFLMGLGLLAAVGAGGAQIYIAVGIGDITQPLIQYNPVCNDPATYAAWQAANPTFQLPPIDQCNVDYLNNGIIQGVITFGVLGCISFFCNFLLNFTWQRAGEQQTKRIRERYLEALLRQEAGLYFDGKDTGEMVTRISGDCNLIQEGISEKVSSIVSYVTVFIGGFVIAFVKGWQMALVVIAVFPLLAGAGAMMGVLLSKGTSEGQESYSKAGAVAQDAIQSIRTVQAFSAEDREVAKYEKELDSAMTKGTINGFVSGSGLGTLFMLLFCIEGLAFWWGSVLIERGTYSGGQVLSVFFALMFGSFTIANVAPSLSALGIAQGAAYEIFGTIDRQSTIDGLSTDGVTADQLRGDIVFKDVGFFYPSRPESQILKEFNLEVKAGTMVALVGGSGSGKSTVIKLINRFYDPQQGSVAIDGRDVKEYNVHSVRSKIGIVSQEPVLFNMSIRDNILMGLESTSGYSKEKLDQMVVEAAETANAREFIEALPASYNTQVLNSLSGGQKQRIAIARAIISNPSVLLLDEATSALDTASERIVQAALDKAAKSRTTVVVAHRLSTIKNADRIVVMEQGTIIESGNHDELVAKEGGVYAGMVAAQALRNKITLDRRASRSVARAQTSTSLADAATRPSPPAYRRVSNAFLGATPLLGSQVREGAVLANSIAKEGESGYLIPGVNVQQQPPTDEHESETEDNDEEPEEEDASALGPAASSKPGTEAIVHMGANGEEIEMAGKKKITRSKTAQSAADLRRQQEEDKERKQKEFEAEMSKKPAPWGRLAKLNAPEWKWLVLGTIGALMNGIIQPIFAVVFSNITNVFSPFNTNLRSEANFWSGMFAVLGVAQFTAWFLQIGFFTMSGEMMTRRIRGDYFRAILRQEIGWFDDEKNSSGILTARLATEATEVKGLTGQLLGSILQVAVSLIAGISIAFANSWQIALVVLACVPIIMAASVIDMRIQAGNTGVAKELYISSTSIATEAVSEIRTVAGLAKERYWLDTYKQALVKPHERILKGTWSKSLAAGFSQGGFFLIWCLSYLAAGKFVAAGIATALAVQTAMFSIIFSALAVGQVSLFAPNILKAKIAAISIFETIDRTTRVDATSNEGKFLQTVKGEFMFQGATFNYPTRPDAAVLRGVDLQGMSGQTVALVGPSGSGKSTVIQLLERFYDVLTGSAQVESIEIRDWNVRKLRENIALVQQEPVLLGGTIKDNIAYGKPSTLPPATMEEIEAAARMANAHDFVSKLPHGYNTKVGSRGSLLSGGQKQRISIARALIRNPKILLLDEATSALDSKSEAIVQDALDKARTGRTTVTIAHRLSTIQNADMIYVFKQGKIIEQGQHQDLVNQVGLYYELVQQQSLASKAIEEQAAAKA